MHVDHLMERGCDEERLEAGRLRPNRDLSAGLLHVSPDPTLISPRIQP